MTIKFTRKKYLEVWRDDRYISRHVSVLKCGESASSDAEKNGYGDYDIRVGTEVFYEVTIRHLAARQLADLIIRRNDSPPTNNPPVWDTQPGTVVVFEQGVAASFDMNDLSSDPDLDAITHTMNTGAAPLGAGVSFVPATGILSYDGIGALGTTSGHVNTLDDGTDTTDSEAYDIVIADLTWPLTGPLAMGQTTPSDIDNVMGTSPWKDFSYDKALVLFQLRPLTTARAETMHGYLTAALAQNSGFRGFPHTLIANSKDDTGTVHKEAFDVIVENGATNKWYAVNETTSDAIFVKSGSFRIVNANFEEVDAGSPIADYPTALYAKYQLKAGSGAAFDWFNLCAGFFDDSKDFQDQFPTRFIDPPTFSVTGNIDYAKPHSSGNTNPDKYRAGYVFSIGRMRAEFGSEFASFGNLGRNNVDKNDSVWKDFWDSGLHEGTQSQIGIERKSGANAFETTTGNVDNKVQTNFWRRSLIVETLIDQSASNRLGKGVVVVDYNFDWSTSLSPFLEPLNDNLPQDHFQIARTVQVMCALHDSMMAAPVSTKLRPCPMLDECAYDVGAPVGGTPSIGTIDNPVNLSADAIFTYRTADQGTRIFWQIFLGGAANGRLLFLWNGNAPDGNADWPDGNVDSITLPGNLGGKSWFRLVSDFNNTGRTTGFTTGQNQSPLINDGTKVVGAINLGRFFGQIFVEEDS